MTLTNFPHDPLLDLDPWVGQRQATFRFELTDSISGLRLGDIHPIREATLSHDTTRTIKRQLSLSLGTADTEAINTLTERVSVFMAFPNGAEYALGKYMFTDASRAVFTSGRLGQMALNDEMFLVDQQITEGVSGDGKPVVQMIAEILADLPIQYSIEETPYNSRESWSIGAGRGQMLESLAVSGDLFSPWFDNTGVMRFIRTFNPTGQVPDLDFDTGNKVAREGILETDDLLTAPNRFVVVSNNSTDMAEPVVGTADIPPNAPHSIANRGFVIASVQNLQIENDIQASAVASGLANRQTIFERVQLTTAPDPRHDSYNVIHWRGELWLELAWSMALVEGGAMGHLLRRGYR